MSGSPLRHHECWVVDAKALDVLVDGRRQWLAAVVDVRSRTMLGHHTGGSRTAAVWGALSVALTKWGAPVRVVADNIRDLPEGVLADLGVKLELSAAYRPSAMLLAERALREVVL